MDGSQLGGECSGWEMKGVSGGHRIWSRMCCGYMTDDDNSASPLESRSVLCISWLESPAYLRKPFVARKIPQFARTGAFSPCQLL